MGTRCNLAELAGRKKNLLEKFLELSGGIDRAVREGKIEEIETIIRERQIIINQVNELDLATPGNGEAADGQLWMQAQQDIHILLNRAKEIDDANRETVLEAREQLASKLKTVREGKKALAIYHGKHVHVEGVFLDKKR
ncbi:MAG: hypothetical protein ACYC2T_04440 [Bacillota bacterium]